ncbi:DNA adenine methylase [Escherichia coli]|nr:hypothetical protein HHJ33_08470 [Escherichia coli]QKX42004.1 DNA adenine methylase [Escherichia coli]
MKKNRAFLKWAGGKYPLLDDIKRHLPKGECLVEPFCRCRVGVSQHRLFSLYPCRYQ